MTVASHLLRDQPSQVVVTLVQTPVPEVVAQDLAVPIAGLLMLVAGTFPGGPVQVPVSSFLKVSVLILSVPDPDTSVETEGMQLRSAVMVPGRSVQISLETDLLPQGRVPEVRRTDMVVRRGDGAARIGIRRWRTRF